MVWMRIENDNTPPNRASSGASVISITNSAEVAGSNARVTADAYSSREDRPEQTGAGFHHRHVAAQDQTTRRAPRPLPERQPPPPGLHGRGGYVEPPCDRQPGFPRKFHSGKRPEWRNSLCSPYTFRAFYLIDIAESCRGRVESVILSAKPNFITVVSDFLQKNFDIC